LLLVLTVGLIAARLSLCDLLSLVQCFEVSIPLQKCAVVTIWHRRILEHTENKRWSDRHSSTETAQV